MKLCMIGTGYVGLVSGACFSDLGNSVICVDKDHKKIDNLKKGVMPIYEPGLDELVKKNYRSGKLKFTSNLKESVLKSDIIFICVDKDTKKIDNLKKGIIPIYEPGVDELVKKNYRSGKLKFTSNLK